MPIKPVDTRMIGGENLLRVGNSYLTNLTSINVSSTNVFTGSIYVNNVLKNINWDNAFTSIQANSATNWGYQGTDLKALSGNWQTAYNIATTYNNISSNFLTQSLSSRFINLEHSTPNDGVNPVLFIGERGDGTGGTIAGSLSGFNVTYNELTNNLIVSTQFGRVAPLTAISVNSNTNVGIGTILPNQRLTVIGSISATDNIQANELQIKDSIYGTNTTMGSAQLVAGSATVSTNQITDNSRVFLTTQVPLPDFASIGSLFVGSRVPTTSFTVSSTNVNDTSIFGWLIVEPTA